ncbi:MAG: hypothetical protein GC131_06155 [Alphaproteobacteria bacterium]|nr:hypothetical protein [Alphaproteobacteria bacterium]
MQALNKKIPLRGTLLLGAMLMLAMPPHAGAADIDPFGAINSGWKDIDAVDFDALEAPDVAESEGTAAEGEAAPAPAMQAVIERINPPPPPSWQRVISSLPPEDKTGEEAAEAADEEDFRVFSTFNEKENASVVPGQLDPYNWHDASKVASKVIVPKERAFVRLSSMPPIYTGAPEKAGAENKEGAAQKPAQKPALMQQASAAQCAPAAAPPPPVQKTPEEIVATRLTRAMELDRQTLQALRDAVRELGLQKELDFIPMGDDKAAPQNKPAPKMDMPAGT